LIKALIRQESAGDPKAISDKGAKGLMQLMDSTAAMLGVTDPFNPSQNIMGGARYLSQLIKRFGGDLVKAIASYNAGPGAVEKYNGIPPYPETRKYVRNVMSSMMIE
jgi:soluble lytic murein transglycosylase-like protein